MGLVASQARLMMLVARQSDLEYAIQMISQRRTALAFRAQEAANNYPQLANQLRVLDRELEIQQKNLETQHKIVQTEYDGIKKVIDKNIERSFKTFA